MKGTLPRIFSRFQMKKMERFLLIEVFIFGFDTDFTNELSKPYFGDSFYESHFHELGKV